MVQGAIKAEKMLDNIRNEFLRDICDAIRQYTLYPTKLEREHVAMQVVAEYPFLKDSIGSGIVRINGSRHTGRDSTTGRDFSIFTKR